MVALAFIVEVLNLTSLKTVRVIGIHRVIEDCIDLGVAECIPVGATETSHVFSNAAGALKNLLL